MSIIGSIVVRMACDNSKFNAGIARSARELDALSASSAKAESSVGGLKFEAPPVPKESHAEGGKEKAVPSDVGAQLTAALAPLGGMAAKINAQFEAVGGTIVTLARRIDGAMKGSALDSTLANVQSRLRSGISEAAKKAQGDLTRVEKILLAWGPAADKAVGGFRVFEKLLSAIKNRGDVAGQSLSNVAGQSRGLGGGGGGILSSVLGAVAGAAKLAAVGLASAGAAYAVLANRATVANAAVAATNAASTGGALAGLADRARQAAAALGSIPARARLAALAVPIAGLTIALGVAVTGAGALGVALGAAVGSAKIAAAGVGALGSAYALLRNHAGSIAEALQGATKITFAGAIASVKGLAAGLAAVPIRAKLVAAGLAAAAVGMATLSVAARGASAALGLIANGARRTVGALGAIAGVTRHVNTALLALGIPVGIFAGVQAFKATIGHAVKSGSDLNETVSKTRAILGDASPAAEAFANQMASKFGLVKKDTLDAVSAFGGLGKGLAGLAGADLSKFSTEFTKLAADLSSFANIDMTEATQALTIGLAGKQSDTLEKMGAILNETTVKQQALSMGMKSVNGKLTEQQKLAARSALIMKALADASGDVDRTFGGVANQSRSLSGSIENTYATLGTALQPATEAITHLATAGMGALSAAVMANAVQLGEWAQTGSQSGGFVFTAFERLGQGVGIVADVVHTVGLGFKYLQVQAGEAVLWISGKLAALGLVSGDFVKALDQQLGPLRAKFTAALAEEPPSTKIKGFFDKVSAAALKAGEASKAVAAAPKIVAAAAADASEKVAKVTDKLKEEIGELSVGKDVFEQWKLKQEGATEGQLAFVRALQLQKSGLEKAKKIQEDAKTPLDKYKAALEDVDQAVAFGALKAIDADKAKLKAKQELIAAIEQETKTTGALQRGSKEEYSARVKSRLDKQRLAGAFVEPARPGGRANAGPGADRKPPAEAKDQLKEAQAQTRLQQAIADGINNLGANLGSAIAGLFPI